MSANLSFKNGLLALKSGKPADAIPHFNEAILLNMDTYALYDARASAYEKIGRHNDALRDVKQSIALAPERWESYTRAARLFLTIKKLENAKAMITHALQRFTSEPTQESDRQRRDAALAQIHALEEQIDQTLAIRARRVAAKRQCQIARLPVELLTETFAYLVFSDQSSIYGLSGTCRHWRDLCISQPHFWHTLRLGSHIRTQKSARVLVERSKGWIRTLVVEELPLHVWEDYHHEVLDQIKWESLRNIFFSSIGPKTWKRFIEKIPCHLRYPFLPALEELEVRMVMGYESSGKHTIRLIGAQTSTIDTTLPEETDYAGYIPPIKSLKLQNCQMSEDSLARFTQLATLSLDSPVIPFDIRIAHRALVQNPDLRVLRLGGDKFTFPAAQDMLQAVRLPHLEDLTIEGIKGPQQLFKCIISPSLRRLRICSNTLTTSSTDILCEMAIQSDGFPLFETLEIDKCPLGAPGKIVTFILARTKLRSLALTRIGAGADLTLKGLIGGACPLLESVNVSHCPDVRTSSVLNLVKDHLGIGAEHTNGGDTQTIAPLKTLIVDGCEHMEAEVIPWLKQVVPNFSCQFMTKKHAPYNR